jgi:hypothetical protein
MSYRKEKTEMQYNSPRRRNQLPSQQSLKGKVQTKKEKETEWIVDWRKPSIKKKEKEKVEITPEPEEIVNKNRRSLGLKVGNQIVDARIHGERENEETIKFPKDTRDKMKIV